MQLRLQIVGTIFPAKHSSAQTGEATNLSWGDFMQDTKAMNDMTGIRRRRDDGLGPNSEIGNKLRALYGAVQDEGIPPPLLDLLDRLDAAEQAQRDAIDTASGVGVVAPDGAGDRQADDR